jgi:hypothetical protein
MSYLIRHYWGQSKLRGEAALIKKIVASSGWELDLAAIDDANLLDVQKTSFHDLSDDQLAEHLMKKGMDVKSLRLDWSTRLTQKAFIYILSFCPDLERLSLKGTNITFDGKIGNGSQVIDHLTQRLPQLVELDLRYCKKVSVQDIEEIQARYLSIGKDLTILQ